MKKKHSKKPSIFADGEKTVYAERIEELKKQNAELTIMLEEYRKKEQHIADALAYADAMQKSIEAELKIKYALECERLSSFRKKWLAAANAGAASGDYEKTLAVLDECRAVLTEEFDSPADKDFREEEIRLSRLDENVTQKNAEKRHIDELSETELQELLRQL